MTRRERRRRQKDRARRAERELRGHRADFVVIDDPHGSIYDEAAHVPRDVALGFFHKTAPLRSSSVLNGMRVIPETHPQMQAYAAWAQQGTIASQIAADIAAIANQVAGDTSREIPNTVLLGRSPWAVVKHKRAPTVPIRMQCGWRPLVRQITLDAIGAGWVPVVPAHQISSVFDPYKDHNRATGQASAQRIVDVLELPPGELLGPPDAQGNRRLPPGRWVMRTQVQFREQRPRSPVVRVGTWADASGVVHARNMANTSRRYVVPACNAAVRTTMLHHHVTNGASYTVTHAGIPRGLFRYGRALSEVTCEKCFASVEASLINHARNHG